MDASTLLPLHHSASVRTNTEVRRIFNPTSLVPGVSERLPTPTHQTYLGRSPRLMAKESAQSSSVQFVGASQPPPLMPDTPYGVVSRLNAKVETSEIKRILAAAESELDATDAARRRRRGSGRQGRWTSKVPPPEPAAAGPAGGTSAAATAVDASRPATGLGFTASGVAVGCVIAERARFSPAAARRR